MNAIGLKLSAFITAAVVITSNAVLGSVGTFFNLLNPTIAAGQTVKCRWWVPFSVGATGGIRLQIVVPAGGVLFNASIKVYNTVTPALITAIQVASAAFTNALAVAGTHWMEVECEIVNGSTAGNVDLQIAQNTSDVLSLTILRGAFCDVTKV
jgi:hypothetical protein